MNKLNFSLLLTIIFLFAACEYEPSGNNFVELTPPEDYIPFEISLNDLNPSDTILMYQNTAFSIKINTPKDLSKVVVLLDGREYTNMCYNSSNFVINPDQISEGVHKLTVNAISSSGTGSLAEMMGLEAYMGELSWNILVIHNPRDRFELGYRINQEGFLEIFWENAVPENFIEKYTVHSGITQNIDIAINDATKKSFVDNGYVCGFVYYEVRTFLKDGYSFLKQLSINTPTPKISFENLGLDNLRVYWNKPFANGWFNLIENNVTIADGINDTTITIPQIFGKYRQFSLETRPQKPQYQNKFKTGGAYYQGTSLGLPNFPLYAYNIKDNINIFE